MKLCPICATSYSAEHRTCPTHGTVLVDTQELPAGTMIRDCYRIVRMLGKGGMGTVYLAEHTLMGEPRALKFLSADLASNPSFVQRFLQEARAANKLRHPNVAQTMELGQTEDGSFYISMEFVDGPSLRTALNQSPGGLPLERAIHIVRGAAMGLGAAHAKHMVHRDVKPENILLASTPEGEVAKVVDFGIVAMSDGASRLTQTGSVLLTCEYAAPEQWRGTIPSSELDGRTDLYSVGCMFFEMLTGRLPYRSETYEGWFQLHVNSEPPVPSSLRPELAQYPGLDAVALRLLAKERENRPANVHEFLAELDRALSGAAPVPVVQEQRARTLVEAPAAGWGQAASASNSGQLSNSGPASNSGQTPAAPGWGTVPAPAVNPNSGQYGQTTWQPAGQAPGPVSGQGQAAWQGQTAVPAPPSMQAQPPVQTPPIQTPPQGMPAYGQPYGQPQGGGAMPPPQFAQPQYAPPPATGYPGHPSQGHPPQGYSPGAAKKKSPIGLIIGIVVAVIVVAGLAIGAAMIYARKKEPAKADQAAAQTTDQTQTPSQAVPQPVVTQPPVQTPAETPAASLPSANAPATEPSKPASTKPAIANPPPSRPPAVKSPAESSAAAATAKEGQDFYNNKQFVQAQPLLTQACSKGDAASCTFLGRMYQLKLGVDQDYAQAVSLFNKGCNGGHLLGCNNLGNLYEHKVGVDQDFGKALSLYQKACNGGEMEGCNNLGVMYLKNEGVSASYKRESDLFTKACDGGSSAGCSDLGYLYKSGGDGVAPDKSKASLYLQKGCNMGSKFGCDQLKTVN